MSLFGPARLLGLLGSASGHQRTIRLFYLQKRNNVHICKCNYIIQNLSKVTQDLSTVWNLVFVSLLLQSDLYCPAFFVLFFTKHGFIPGTSWTCWICQDPTGIYIFARFLLSIFSPWTPDITWEVGYLNCLVHLLLTGEPWDYFTCEIGIMCISVNATI